MQKMLPSLTELKKCLGNTEKNCKLEIFLYLARNIFHVSLTGSINSLSNLNLILLSLIINIVYVLSHD